MLLKKVQLSHEEKSLALAWLAVLCDCYGLKVRIPLWDLIYDQSSGVQTLMHLKSLVLEAVNT